MIKYNGFYTLDVAQTDWWMRCCYIPSAHEVGLLVLQHSKLIYEDMLNVGLVIGADEKDAYRQLARPTFDRTLDDSDLLLRIETVLKEKDLLNVMRNTAAERELGKLQIIGDSRYAFDNKVLDLFKQIGFRGTDTTLHMEVNERNRNND